MNKNTTIKVLAIASIAILSGCSKEAEDNPETPDGQSWPGEFIISAGTME